MESNPLIGNGRILMRDRKKTFWGLLFLSFVGIICAMYCNPTARAQGIAPQATIDPTASYVVVSVSQKQQLNTSTGQPPIDIGDPAYATPEDEVSADLLGARIYWGDQKNLKVSFRIMDASFVGDGLYVRLADASYFSKTDCLIQIYPYFWKLSLALRQDTINHEFGHCLGLGHNPDPRSIMYFQVLGGGIITDYDRYWYNFNWYPRTTPGVYTLTVGMITHN